MHISKHESLLTFPNRDIHDPVLGIANMYQETKFQILETGRMKKDNDGR